MTIKAKILSLVAVFALLAAAITALGLKTMGEYDQSIDAYNHASDNVLRGERLNRFLTLAALDGRTLYGAKTPADVKATADQIDVHANGLTTLIGDWDQHLKPGELPEYTKVRKDVLTLANDGHHLATIARGEGLPAADAYGDHPEYRASRELMQANIDAMGSRIQAQQVQSRAALARFETDRKQQFLLIAGTGILMLLAASLWIAIDAIAVPLRRVSQSIVSISEGAYDTPMPASGRGEIGQLWGALSILKERAIEAERLTKAQIEHEHALRELMLD